VHQILVAGLDTGPLDDLSGDTDHGAVIGDVLQHHGSGTDTHVVTDGDVTEDGGTASDDHVVAQGWVPLALVERDSPQGDSLEQGHVVADDRRLSDDHAGGMVDEEPLPDRRTGVYVASGQVVCTEVDVPGLLLLALEPQLMAEPVHAHCPEAGVEALKEAGAELIICAMHWGIEGSYQVLAAQEAVAYAAIDAGADIIWGSHPHVLHRVEAYRGGYILYSMGNWSFGGNTAPRDRDTAIAQITVKREADGTVSLETPVLIPCKLSGHDAYNDYQPQPLDPESAEYARAMSKLDGSFTGPDLSIDYSAFH